MKSKHGLRTIQRPPLYSVQKVVDCIPDSPFTRMRGGMESWFVELVSSIWYEGVPYWFGHRYCRGLSVPAISPEEAARKSRCMLPFMGVGIVVLAL